MSLEPNCAPFLAKRLDNGFKTAFFGCRFRVVLAVLGSLVAALIMFLKDCIELVQAVKALYPVLLSFQPSHADDKAMLLSVIPAVYYYLFAMVLLIFNPRASMSCSSARSTPPAATPVHPPQIAERKYITPADMLYLAGAILLVAVALYVLHHIIFNAHDQELQANQKRY